VLTLDRVVRRGASDLHRVDLPFPGLTRLGYGLAMGQVGMVAAGPGVGKSAWSTQVALELGLPTLYVQSDTDRWTQTVRALAHLTGHPQSYIEQCLEGGHASDELEAAMHFGRHVTWSFDTWSIKDLETDLAAYGTVHGQLPKLIVIDNVRNLARSGDSRLDSQEKLLDELHALAGSTGAHVLALHHATGQYHNGDKPIPLEGIENKLTQLPSHVLTLFRKDQFTHMCVVKNRTGKVDPSGHLQVRARFDGERQTFIPED
jgi:predicted ATP-dependent serine protease